MVSQINTLTSGSPAITSKSPRPKPTAITPPRVRRPRSDGGRTQRDDGCAGHIDDQGNYNVTLKNGQPLVSGSKARPSSWKPTPTARRPCRDFRWHHLDDDYRHRRFIRRMFDYQNDVLTPLTDTINSMARSSPMRLTTSWRRATISTVTRRAAVYL